MIARFRPWTVFQACSCISFFFLSPILYRHGFTDYKNDRTGHKTHTHIPGGMPVLGDRSCKRNLDRSRVNQFAEGGKIDKAKQTEHSKDRKILTCRTNITYLVKGLKQTGFDSLHRDTTTTWAGPKG